MSWDEANDNCTRQDAELVSIFSSQEDSFIYGEIMMLLLLLTKIVGQVKLKIFL